MRYSSCLLASALILVPAAHAERAILTNLFAQEDCSRCSSRIDVAVESPILTAGQSSDIEIQRVPGGFTVDGSVREPLEVRLVSGQADEPKMLGLWTGGRVMFGYTCDTACTVVVQKRGQGEILRSAGL